MFRARNKADDDEFRKCLDKLVDAASGERQREKKRKRERKLSRMLTRIFRVLCFDKRPLEN